jgi:hypothetical protein
MRKLRRLAMESERLKYVLPKLAQIMAKDFNDFSGKWEEVLKTYAKILGWLNWVSGRGAVEIEKGAVEIIERYIEKRERGFKGNYFVPAYICLAYELSEMQEKILDKIMEEWEREICELMEEWEREDYDSDGGEYDETGHL